MRREGVWEGGGRAVAVDVIIRPTVLAPPPCFFPAPLPHSSARGARRRRDHQHLPIWARAIQQPHTLFLVG